MATIGSILHGAYGDYYEQMLCLKDHKRRHPDDRLVLFFESDARLRELAVFDLSFADQVHPARAIGEVPVDRYLQFQVKDEELKESVLTPKAEQLRGKLDTETNLKPWTVMKRMALHDPASDVGLSDFGRARLPDVVRENGLDERILERAFTVGFLWRYRAAGHGAAISNWRVPAAQVVRREKSALFEELIRRYDAHILVCGMNLTVTDENRTRVDAKFTDSRLDLDSPNVHYLKGLSWGLELEILRRARLCIVMPSGFSEALWIKRAGAICLVDAPPHYVAKVLYNRMPLFDLMRPSELYFQLRQPHTKERVLAYLRARSLLPS
jgi:hypothetical protein